TALVIILALLTGCAGNGSDDSTTPPEDTGAGSVGTADDAFCDAYIDFFLSGQDFPDAFDPGAGSAHLADARGLYAAGAEHLRTALAVAPDAIAGDLETMAEAWSTASNQAEDADSAEEIPTDFFELPELQEASDTVGNYAREHCPM